MSKLARFFRPASIAVVGASTNQSRSNYSVPRLLESGADIFLVNPKRPELYGEKTYPNLESIGRSVDAVFAMVNAERVMEVVREASQLGAGGVVVNASGFAEIGGDGIRKQLELVEAAGAMPILGPNCNGFIDVNSGVRLSGAPPLPIRGGGIGLVTHTGALIGSVGVAGFERGVGFSHMISTGNEAAVDMADCLDFLVQDPRTRTICLIVESIRRPDAFFKAADRAASAGKPIVALKLGRSARAQAIAASHTAALAGDAQVYEWAFRQHGIERARDLEELIDRVICFEQLPQNKWSRLDGLAVITASGGGAQMAADTYADFGVTIPPLPEVKSRLQASLPGAQVVNPLDLTGLALGNREITREIMSAYAEAPDVDTLVLQWFLDDKAFEMGGVLLEEFVAAAKRTGKTALIGSVEDGRLGSWAAALPDQQIGVTRGLVGTVRALQTMGAFTRYSSELGTTGPVPRANPQPQPAAGEIVEVQGVRMLRFPAAMTLLERFGFEVAPYLVIEADMEPSQCKPSFNGPYFVKLADVPHRTDIGAVRASVTEETLATAVAELRGLARTRNLPAAVVIQKQLSIDSEAFLGIKADGDLGATVTCGIGGIFVELLKAVVGGVAPFGLEQARRQLAALEKTGIFEGLRGRSPWNRDDLAAAMVQASLLAESARDWVQSLDINPLAFSDGRFIALDCLCVCNEDGNQ